MEGFFNLINLFIPAFGATTNQQTELALTSTEVQLKPSPDELIYTTCAHVKKMVSNLLAL